MCFPRKSPSAKMKDIRGHLTFSHVALTSVRVAVGISVARYLPQRSLRAALGMAGAVERKTGLSICHFASCGCRLARQAGFPAEPAVRCRYYGRASATAFLPPGFAGEQCIVRACYNQAAAPCASPATWSPARTARSAGRCRSSTARIANG